MNEKTVGIIVGVTLMIGGFAVMGWNLAKLKDQQRKSKKAAAYEADFENLKNEAKVWVTSNKTH